MKGNRLATAAITLMAAALFLALLNWGAHLFFGPYGRRLLIAWGINSLLAVSLNLVNGQTGQFSLGHAGFMAVGAYASALLAISQPEGFGPFLGDTGSYLWILALFLAAGSAAALVGVLVAIPIFAYGGIIWR